MSKGVIFKGVATAIVTPMNEDMSINYEEFKNLIEFQIRNKADALVVAGITGECATLSDDEHIELVRRAVKIVRGRIPVIAGAGSNNTAHAVCLSRKCEEAGADALLHVTPYYNRTSQEGLYLHFRTVAESTELPIILYNDPPRTGINISPATYKRLSEIENIVACEEASGNFPQMAKIASMCKDDLTIYTGNDDQITSSLSLGAQGVVSVLSNIIPAEIHAICRSFFAGNMEKSEILQKRYLDLMETLFIDVNPIPIKEAMRAMGFGVGKCRLPLCDLEPTGHERLYQTLRAYDLVGEDVKEGLLTVAVQRRA